jgi:hypothetical protein
MEASSVSSRPRDGRGADDRDVLLFLTAPPPVEDRQIRPSDAPCERVGSQNHSDETQSARLVSAFLGQLCSTSKRILQHTYMASAVTQAV